MAAQIFLLSNHLIRSGTRQRDVRRCVRVESLSTQHIYTHHRGDTKKMRETRPHAEFQHSYCCCRRSSSPAKSRSSSRREAPPSPPVPNPVIDKAPSRRAEPDEQLQFQGGELR